MRNALILLFLFSFLVARGQSSNYIPRPQNGFSPYNEYVGEGVYKESDGNKVIIENGFSTDAVVLLINAFSNKKIRNEYIRKGETFEMTNVPDGTYYIKWASGNNWNPNKRVGKWKGGFETDVSFTGAVDRKDWSVLESSDRKYDILTYSLYSVQEGNLEGEDISSDEFAQ